MSTTTARISFEGLSRAGVALSGTAVYALFAWVHGLTFVSNPRPSVALIVLLETLVAAFLVARRSSDSTSRATWDWMVTISSTFAPLLLRPAQELGDRVAGEAVQMTGIALAVLAVLSLNRSIGLVPAHRGVKTQGLYRFVRHPLYLAYSLAQIGYLASNFTAWNVLVVVVAFALYVVRIESEEKLLSRYPDYRAYQARTRWRIVPCIY